MTTSSSGTTGSSSTTSDTGDVPELVCCDKDGCIGPVGEDCTVWEQDCPEGQKCVPVPDCDLGWWTAEKCIPIVENPAQLGEDCITLSGGVDNCIKGAYCWHATDKHPGTCIPLCHDQNSPVCDDPELQCVVDSGDSTLGVCLAACDPLIDSCPQSDEKCAYPSSAANFICWPIIPPEGEEPGTVHSSCDYDEACGKGLVCINNPPAAEECDPNASRCCEPYCDLTDPDPGTQCPGVGQKCIPYFNDGEAPPGQENVGVCAVPF